MENKSLEQISNYVYCDSSLNSLDIETKLLPNPYYDYPFLIIKNFFSDEICKEIVKSIKRDEDCIDAKVKAENYENHIDKDIRKTKIYKLDKEFRSLYNKIFKEFQPKIEQYFNLALTTSTKIQVLEYTKGSFYVAHSDDSNMIIDDEELIGFKCVAVNRKVTTVLFATSCNDENSENSFTGGELIFNYLYDKEGNVIKYAPQAGDMVVFLSNPYFTHEVLEVKSGYRLSIVQWHDALVT
ncbi:prolyl hydroxylase family protein [Halarcobacter ebronensis]|uniref:Fe2OG dioxygenase domain-containing protein n=1 Tax=Halarcobacter ebronensis TaxID=1462615 RepID=A0A4Q1AFW6_9BACT|nr:2OG-Fe(II) oxygenase [Halarcobacter ebronensis]QKF81465.1 2OG-Fe(II) oxygenase family protein [Halarcobacter ebronensis]RXK02473.1 hypothetical protein CRV07_13465 [Halarcobacter ebronensis]